MVIKEMIEKLQNSEDWDLIGVKTELVEKIYCLIEDNKMTKAEVARELNVDPAMITRYLKGYTNFTLKTIVRFARVFGKKVEINFK